MDRDMLSDEQALPRAKNRSGKVVSVYMRRSLIERLDEIARATGRTRSAVIHQALRLLLAQYSEC
jgi:metal-responsive CopG/Arc/MetJ family transcriptional regulator